MIVIQRMLWYCLWHGGLKVCPTRAPQISHTSIFYLLVQSHALPLSFSFCHSILISCISVGIWVKAMCVFRTFIFSLYLLVVCFHPPSLCLLFSPALNPIVSLSLSLSLLLSVSFSLCRKKRVLPVMNHLA